MFLWMLAGLAQGATWTVPGDFNSLALAALAASDGDVIEVDAALFERGNLDAVIANDLTIVGINGTPTLPRLNIALADVTVENVILKGTGDRLLDIGSDVAVFATLASLTVRNSSILPAGVPTYGGTEDESIGVVTLGTQVVLDTVTVRDFATEEPVIAVGAGSLDVLDSTFEANLGTALTAADAPVTVTNSVFVSNQSKTTGAIWMSNLGSKQPLTIEGCTFEANEGATGAAVLVANGDLTVRDSDFSDNIASEAAGAVFVAGYADDLANLDITDTTFLGNLGYAGGGAVVAYNVSGAITRAEFADNFATAGGGILWGGGGLTIAESTFTNNLVWWAGGHLMALSDPYYDVGYGTVDIVDSSFSCVPDYYDAADGGALALFGDVHASLRNSTISDCEAFLTGGAITHLGTSLVVEDSQLERTAAWQGGAIESLVGSLSIARSTIKDTETNWGGAIGAVGNEVSIVDSSVIGTWTEQGGALIGDDLHALTLTNTRFCANTSSSEAATVSVVAKLGDAYSIRNNVFLHNSSESLGAALLIELSDFATDDGPQIEVHNNDFLGNDVSAGVLLRGGVVDLRNNIVMDHPIGVLLEDGVLGKSGDHNLYFQNGSDVEGGLDALPGPHGVSGLDPLFAGYSDGNCDSDLHLQLDSPARDSGDPEILDPDGSVSDIGAFGGPEAQVEDNDGDGIWSDLDCDDTDPSVGLCDDGQEEPPDGCDLDGDGFEDPSCGGDDCDDADGTIFPGAPDQADDGIDQDCDGFEPKTWVNGGGGCGCAPSGPASPGWPMGLLLLGLRRRR